MAKSRTSRRMPLFKMTKMVRRPAPRTASVRQKYPKIEASDFLSADGYTVIVDTGSLKKDRRAVRKVQSLNRPGASKGVIHIVNGVDLTKKMLGLVRRNLGIFRGKKVLVVYPGEAAQTVRKYIGGILANSRNAELKRVFSNSVSVRARRIVQDGKPSVAVEAVPLEKLGRADVVLVVDDVVSSTQTAGRLRQTSVDYAYKVVDETSLHLRARSQTHIQASNATWANWYLATWVMAEPSTKEKTAKGRGPAGVGGYEKVFAAGVIKSTADQIPAINSLSTFLRTDSKGRAVRESFVEKAVENKSLFDSIIKSLRGKK